MPRSAEALGCGTSMQQFGLWLAGSSRVNKGGSEHWGAAEALGVAPASRAALASFLRAVLHHAGMPGHSPRKSSREAPGVLIPSGYLPLRQVIRLVAEQLFPDARARNHIQKRSSETDWACCVSADAPDAARQAIEDTRQILQQAFVDGALPAFILMEGTGRQPGVPLSAWRSEKGAPAMRAGVISWAPAPGVKWGGPVFVRDEALTSWLLTKLANEPPDDAISKPQVAPLKQPDIETDATAAPPDRQPQQAKLRRTPQVRLAAALVQLHDEGVDLDDHHDDLHKRAIEKAGITSHGLSRSTFERALREARRQIRDRGT